MSNSMIIGLTGPTGSGKGIVSAAWAAQGACVLDADRFARSVVEPGEACLQQLVQAFGSSILMADGRLNRQALAAVAFADPAKQQQLNAITHPAIRRKMSQQAAQAHAAGQSIVVFDSPLLFESGQQEECHLTVAVLARPELRLARIMARDGLSKEQARLRVQAQPSDDYYRQRADVLWENNEDRAALEAQAKEWLRCQR